MSFLFFIVILNKKIKSKNTDNVLRPLMIYMTSIYNYIIVICNINNLVLLSVLLLNSYNNNNNHFLVLNLKINTKKIISVFSVY